MTKPSSKSESLFRLIYASESAHPFTVQELAEMLLKARALNRSQQISGILCQGERRFLQCLEGPRDGVNELYGRIARDPRHTRVTLLGCSEISVREFPNWDMAYIHNTRPYLKLIQDLGHTSVFDPHNLDATDALYLLRFMTLGLTRSGDQKESSATGTEETQEF